MAGDAPTPGKQKRLGFLCDKLGIDIAAVGSLRYQLLHRTVSALLEADRFRAVSAVMLVHSWSEELAGFDDYAEFCRALGAEAAVGGIVDVPGRHASLYLGWVRGNRKWLAP